MTETKGYIIEMKKYMKSCVADATKRVSEGVNITWSTLRISGEV